MTPTTVLDPAVAAVDRAVEIVRYDRPAPADLSAVIASMRELFWHTTTLTGVVLHAYDQPGIVGHDSGGDPQASVTTITGQLRGVADLLASIDTALNETHNHAAHLLRR